MFWNLHKGHPEQHERSDSRARPDAVAVHQLNHELSAADAILVLCSHDVAVAECGAQLFLEGWAPLLIYSGGFGSITKALWTEPEADRFAAVAIRRGVPRERILIENRSSNTGENVTFTRQPGRVKSTRRCRRQSWVRLGPEIERRLFLRRTSV